MNLQALKSLNGNEQDAASAAEAAVKLYELRHGWTRALTKNKSS
jgi:hypothetical protein